MGRHSAAPAVDADTLLPSGPVTDPRLLDTPLPSTRRRDTQVRAGAVQLSPDVVAAPLPRPKPGLVHTRPAPSALMAPTRSGRTVDEVVGVDGDASGVPFAPVPVRTSVRHADDPVVPQVSSPSLLGPRRQDVRPVHRYARTGPVAIMSDGPSTRSPGALTRKREAVLAAAALAVVGAMSGAAALLPSNPSEAQAASKAPPTRSPVPSASGGASGRTGGPGSLGQTVRRDRPGTSASHPSATDGATPRGGTSASATASPAETRPPHPSRRGASSSDTGIDLPTVLSNLSAGLFTFADFSTQSSGRLVSSGVLKGAGVGKTVVKMAENTSTKSSAVPGNGNNQGGLANPTNPLWLLSGVKDLEDVTVQGTTQGHLYNGVNMTGENLVIRNAEVNDIPGNSNANPGETFAIGVNRATGTGTVDHLTINGGSGSLASAAGLAINNSTADWNISNLTTNGLRYSAGIALWQVRGTLNIRNYVQQGGPRSLGAERMAGTVNLYDPVWSAGTSGHDVTYTWDGGFSGGSINFYYSSASKVPDRKIQILTNKASGIAGSVHVYVGGVRKTTSDYVTVN